MEPFSFLPFLAALIVFILLVVVIQLWRLDHRLAQIRSGDQSRQIRDEFSQSRSEASEESTRLRQEIAKSQTLVGDSIINTLKDVGEGQQKSIDGVEKRVSDLVDSNEKRLDKQRDVIDKQLKSLQDSNEKKLDQMRATVEEKLQSTLDKRLGESFNLVSERLEAVQKGLGEMQSLATGVGDLKRVLTNVKTRGTWGEFQLGDILEQILTPDQYSRNVRPNPASTETVEYAIRLPGNDDDSTVWLAIDAKFPLDDYQRILDAAQTADADVVRKSTDALMRTVVRSAKDISAKYIEPPHTTDFAIMFLPIEGLYAEVLRQPGMLEKLQYEHRVVIAGPTSLSAILNSLRMGFRTLAIEKRSSEVWKVLSAVKTEFGKFGDVLAKVKRQLKTASNTIDATEVRTRAMERRLRTVDALPDHDATEVLQLEDGVRATVTEEDADD